VIRRISAALACAVLGISDPCTATAAAQPSNGSSVVRSGETFATTRNHPHASQNPGHADARAVVTWIVDAGAPLP